MRVLFIRGQVLLRFDEIGYEIAQPQDFLGLPHLKAAKLDKSEDLKDLPL